MEAPALAESAAEPVVPSVALYVGDLHEDVGERTLIDFFSQAERPESVRICRDAVNGRSLGYGYVNYETTEKALRVIEKLNRTLLNGKPVRIMMSSSRDSDARKSGVGNLFVKNLADSVDEFKLQEIFSEHGTISSCKISTSVDGKSKGYGFVQFETQESANMALKKLNGFDIGGKQIFVSHFIKRSERVPPNSENNYTNLYMKNLDHDITEELLRLKFSEFGKITNLAIAKDANDNSKGFAFVNFENPDDARRALENMNGAQLGSKTLYVARAQKKAERQQLLRQLYEERRNERIRKNMACNLYVKNIEDSVNDDDLRKYFSEYGNITSAVIMRNEKGTSKGFGFVCFSAHQEANEAVKAFHGKMFHGKPLYVAFAQRKEDRQAQLQIYFSQLMAGYTEAMSAVIPPGLPVYYTPPPCALPQFPSRQGLMYPPFGMRPEWRPNGFIRPNRPLYPPMPFPSFPNTARPHRQNRGRVHGHFPPQNSHLMPYLPRLQPNLVNAPKGTSHVQRTGHTKYMPNGRPQDMSNGSINPTTASNINPTTASNINPTTASNMHRTDMLAAATPREQKQILGELLFPLVQHHKADLAGKITGMLLEMDNAELLLLLDSPEALASKVDEAVQVLERSQFNVENKKAVSSKILSSEVAVN